MNSSRLLRSGQRRETAKEAAISPSYWGLYAIPKFALVKDKKKEVPLEELKRQLWLKTGLIKQFECDLERWRTRSVLPVNFTPDQLVKIDEFSKKQTQLRNEIESRKKRKTVG